MLAVFNALPPGMFVMRFSLSLALAIAATLVGGCAPLGKMSPLLPIERAVVFHPAAYPAGNWSPVDLAFEDAWFEAKDGTQLHGWYVAHPHPRGIALYCHGNAGNVTVLTDVLRALNERHGLAVMSFDYRGYGRSDGQPSEPGVLQDARAARRWLSERTATAEKDIILIGRSLGGAVAIDLAATDGARALVLDSTFTSLPDIGASLLPWLLPRWNMTMRMDSLAKIERYPGPLLISHGDKDEVIPFAQGEKLYESAPGSKRFFREQGGKHNDPHPAEYHGALEEFLASIPAPSAAPTPAWAGEPGAAQTQRLTAGEGEEARLDRGG